MSRYERTPSKVMVTPLDLSESAEQARVWLNKHREIDGKSLVSKMTDDGPWGIVETPEGIYALCQEGVGPDHPITDEQPLEISWYVRGYEGEGENFISMFPACSSKGNPDDLREIATGEPVRLCDFIRSFGSRLDSNYESWRRRLEKALAVSLIVERGLSPSERRPA